jgi:hypothetical protein
MAKKKLTLDLVATKLSSGSYKDKTNANAGVMRSSLTPTEKLQAHKMIMSHFGTTNSSPNFPCRKQTRPVKFISDENRLISIIVELGFDKCRDLMRSLRSKD